MSKKYMKKLRKNYKYLIFDFDGTINDTSQGIYATFTAVLRHFGIDASGADLSEHIGPPLKYSYTKLVGRERCDQAIELHAKYFAELNAVAMSKPYDGVIELLDKLKQSGRYAIALASCKYQPHLDASLEAFGLNKYFDCAYAQTESRQFKSEVINALIEDCGYDRKQCLMIGDTLNDVDGAVANGIDVVAVTYGFGSKAELVNSQATAVVESPRELLQLLL